MPDELAPAWRLLAGRYKEYLPEIKMESASFVALPDDGAALLRELEEIRSCQNPEKVLSRGATG